ncbi:MAG TPA: 1,4-alpha-glucan branching protein domain-containing protein [Planctomycetota bacterium]|nr:1,4-alpha-glucan branching protein domain-containing protein [Planctomycetota bacterium]
MLKGYLSIVLHAHLPYVRHPSFSDFMEEDWLYEAITETYLPLLAAFEDLHRNNIPFRMTISLSPPLSEMLTDELLQNRYSQHLARLADLADQEVTNTASDGLFRDTARMYQARFKKLQDLYHNQYHRNLVKAFDKFQKLGYLEIITCAGTHGFLPLMRHPESVRAQVMTAVRNYQKHFARKPAGIWLPECGYYPGLEKILADAGIKYFILDTHGITNGSPAPVMNTYLPVYTDRVNKIAAFGRDAETSRQVWSAKEGYPGDANYREFYRDLGYDADYQYIKPYLHSDGVRRNVGIKYYRITGDVPLHLKQPYNRNNALAKIQHHADNFIFNRRQQLEYHSIAPTGLSSVGMNGTLPILTAPYDAELFGHWWFEGPDFIETLVRKINSQDELKLITPTEYLKQYPKLQVSQPSFSTWGDGGYCKVWLNGKNDWFYRHLHKAEARMLELANQYPVINGLHKKALNQMARELLLAQSSDWTFLITTQHSECYAQNRFKTHLSRFNRLYEDIKNDTIDETYLDEIQQEDNLFKEMDYKVYVSQ